MTELDPRRALRTRQREVFLATAFFVAPALEAQRRLTGLLTDPTVPEPMLAAAHPPAPPVAAVDKSPTPAEPQKPAPDRGGGRQRSRGGKAQEGGDPAPEITQPHHWSGTPPPAMPDGTPWP